MTRSRSRRAGGGGRLKTVGLFLTLLAVAALVGSAAWAFFGRRAGAGRGAAPSVSAPAPVGRVRVEVLNASGRPGLAREATRILRDRGFDVVSFGNARGFGPDTSQVLDRVGRMDAARQVADALAIRRVLARPDSNLYLDATVVLGRDWRQPAPDSTLAEPR
ncbi:MAG TPA: LytR C-terminal domain-containing protein [Longimicrobium sp.]|jgi:hypothetical protein